VHSSILAIRDDIRRINERRREHNRLGFAVQLCLLRYSGWPLKVGEKPPSNLLEFVAQQIDADPDEFGDYAAREQTRQEPITLTGTYH
jgi:TnpA family transposase